MPPKEEYKVSGGELLGRSQIGLTFAASIIFGEIS